MHSDQDRSEIIDPIYLPFARADLHRHFLADADRQIRYFEESAARYHKFLAAHPDRNGVPLTEASGPCQIEKDERFWTATALKHVVDSPTCIEVLSRLLSKAFGERPPLIGLPDWPSCLAGGIELILEATLASPPSYVEWLRRNLSSQHLVPYVRHAADRDGARTLEGATHVDGLIINQGNGFSLFVEAKVLSDISTKVSFDMFRNQMARNIDVLLEEGHDANVRLKGRRPERSLFALLTPACFRRHPHSRLYGFLFEEYKAEPSRIGRDLQYRDGADWPGVARRLGWMTFEEIAAALPDACPWLKQAV